MQLPNLGCAFKNSLAIVYLNAPGGFFGGLLDPQSLVSRHTRTCKRGRSKEPRWPNRLRVDLSRFYECPGRLAEIFPHEFAGNCLYGWLQHGTEHVPARN